MLKIGRILFVMMLGSLTWMTLGCDSGGSGGGGGAVQIQASNDGEFVGFLWKPRSESNGRLVVLLPAGLRGQVLSADIHNTDSSSADTRIEVGRFAGDTHNGARPHFRFDGSGASYGSDIWVIAKTSSGETLGWNVPNGASRVD